VAPTEHRRRCRHGAGRRRGLTTNDVDDGSQVGPLLDRIDGPIASFTADGAYDQDGRLRRVAARHSRATVIVATAFECGAERDRRDGAHST